MFALACLALLMPQRGLAAPVADDPGLMIVTRSTLGAWELREDAANPGSNCVVRFLAAKKNAAGLALLGPAPGSSASTILFNGPGVPSPRSAQEVRIELLQTGLPSTELRARQLPGTDSGSGGFLAVAVGDLRQTLASMRASERDMKVRLDGAEVLTLDYDGLDQARNAMLTCLEGRRFAGKSLKEATAEIRPLGTSTIAGNAFYKAAILARKQDPPKGSQAVGLIWMTDEFKAWQESIKRAQKLPDRIPENILKHFMLTTIVDDKGGFRFTNLPAGDYTLIANFSYEENINRPELIGQTDVYAGNRHIGTNDHVAWWSYTVKQGTSFEKSVAISKDGDTLEVTLDKSLLGCFLVCR